MAKPSTLTIAIVLAIAVAVLTLVAAYKASADGQAKSAAPAARIQLSCADNLCGMDNYCSCHEASSSGRRCWSQADDCNVDLQCCEAGADGCKSQGSDRCSKATGDARAKRDAAAAATTGSATTNAPVWSAGRAYFVLPLTNGMPKIPDCNEGEIMLEHGSRRLWLCDAHHRWWSLVSP